MEKTVDACVIKTKDCLLNLEEAFETSIRQTLKTDPTKVQWFHEARSALDIGRCLSETATFFEQFRSLQVSQERPKVADAARIELLETAAKRCGEVLGQLRALVLSPQAVVLLEAMALCVQQYEENVICADELIREYSRPTESPPQMP